MDAAPWLGAPVMISPPSVNRAGRSTVLSSKRPVWPFTKLTTALPELFSVATCTALLGPEGDAAIPRAASVSRPDATPTKPAAGQFVSDTFPMEVVLQVKGGCFVASYLGSTPAGLHH